VSWRKDVDRLDGRAVLLEELARVVVLDPAAGGNRGVAVKRRRTISIEEERKDKFERRKA
jgi:hypothetical protein